jgi:RIO kinase 1
LDEDQLFSASDGFERSVRPARRAWDDEADVDPDASTYQLAEHGPDPVPEWVITEDAARQYVHGVMKTGKEANVSLVEREFGERLNLLAAKRFRTFEDRMFRNDARYRQNRRSGESRVDRAVARGTKVGMAFRARQWVQTEFETLARLWTEGASVPYPVQRLGPEIMMEYLGDEQGGAPRLVDYRGSPRELRDLYHQLLENLTILSRNGIVHGDLSPYNLLVWHGRLYLIDFPQAVDPILNPDGLDLLQRDVINTCTWFAKRNVRTDPGGVLADLTTHIFSG